MSICLAFYKPPELAVHKYTNFPLYLSMESKDNLDIPKLKYSIWYKICLLIELFGMGDMKWTEHVITWLVESKKVCAKLGKENIYFEDLK